MSDDLPAESSLPPPSPPSPGVRRGLGRWAGGMTLVALAAAGFGVAAWHLHEEKQLAREARDEAATLMREAEDALTQLETMEERRRLADEVFPLPRNPFGGPRPAGSETAQIPPPPPRMHEIPGSRDLQAAEAEVTQGDLPKMRTPQAAKALELAKLKEADQDVISALKHLDVANHLEPNHPEVLYRMGVLFDKLGNKSRAAGYFQTVAAMENRAGELAQLATHYLNGRKPEDLPGGLMQRPLSVGPAFAKVTTDDAGARTVKLSLSIRAATGHEVDPQEVVPYIYFYDLVDGHQIIPCDGEQPPVDEVNPWRSETPDYQDPEEELLDVTYHIPPINDGAERKFFGYVVKLYYRDEIQDVLVEPRVLVELLSETPAPGYETELEATLFEQP